mgnify:CR=1 FL=1|jgi:acyl-CoA thioester hydrolase
MKSNFTHKTSLRVRYGETDQMGYSYYGNYAQYFEVGRVEALRALGMSYKTLEEQEVMLPVSELNVEYKSPAKYDDLLTVQTTISEFKGTRITFTYTVHNESGKLVSNGRTTLVFVSKSTKKPMRPPSNFVDLISKHQVEE